MKKQIKVKLALGLAIVALLISEFYLAAYRPDIIVWRQIKNRVSSKYPSEYSDFLPFSLPRDTVMEHVFDTEPTRTTYRFNRLGFRGPEVPAPAESTDKRLLILGDSFTFGWRMDEDKTFPAMLQSHANSTGEELSVINAGYHSGYSPDAYYASLLAEWDYFSPDAIVVALYENDIQDMDNNRWLEIDEQGLPTRLETIRPYLNPAGEFNDRHKQRYQYPLLRDSRIFLTAWREFIEPDYKVGRDPQEAYRACLAGIARIAEERNVKLLFMLIPPIVKPTAQATPGTSRPITYDFFDPSTAATREYITNSLRAPVLDLSEILNKEPDPYSLAIPGDGHFSVLGNMRTAEALVQALKELGFRS